MFQTLGRFHANNVFLKASQNSSERNEIEMELAICKITFFFKLET